MIQVDNVTFAYSDSDNVLRNINLEINDGESVAILGGNGVGKSTLGLLLCGLLQPNNGNISIDGEQIQDLKQSTQYPQKIQLCFQNPAHQIVNFSVEREIAFGLENLSVPHTEIVDRVEEIIHQFGFEHLRSVYPGDLSGGELQKLTIASAMVMKPNYLILDEPTAFLDPIAKQKILEIIKSINHELTIILITTQVDVSLICDRIIGLDNGTIIFDETTESLFQNENLFNEKIEIPFRYKLVRELKNNNINIDYKHAVDLETLASRLDSIN